MERLSFPPAACGDAGHFSGGASKRKRGDARLCGDADLRERILECRYIGAWADMQFMEDADIYGRGESIVLLWSMHGSET